MEDDAGPVTVFWRSLVKTTAAVFLTVVVPAMAGAHPFPFDIREMAGFEVLTTEDGAVDARDMVVIRYRGPVAFPMAQNLRRIWSEISRVPRFRTVVVRLDSPGGLQSHGAEVIDILREIRESRELVTLVAEGDLCASMCVPLFIQGSSRIASPASAWMFHGAARFMSNVPHLPMTQRYVEHFIEREVGVAFVQSLLRENYLTLPGEYWLSGSELAAVSDIITRLVPNWKPAVAEYGPAGGILPSI